jgi:hypothetical protein
MISDHILNHAPFGQHAGGLAEGAIRRFGAAGAIRFAIPTASQVAKSSNDAALRVTRGSIFLREEDGLPGQARQ